jgi:hypothetical protein
MPLNTKHAVFNFASTWINLSLNLDFDPRRLPRGVQLAPRIFLPVMPQISAPRSMFGPNLLRICKRSG